MSPGSSNLYVCSVSAKESTNVHGLCPSLCLSVFGTSLPRRLAQLSWTLQSNLSVRRLNGTTISSRSSKSLVLHQIRAVGVQAHRISEKVA